jgi:hypothetical protein
MSLRKRQALYLGIVVFTAVAGTTAIGDYVCFENTCERVTAVSNELGGCPLSIGGWPIGRECVIRFDHPLTDEALRRFVTVVPESRRISVSLYFSCKIPEARLTVMRNAMAPHHITIVANTDSSEDMRVLRH